MPSIADLTTSSRDSKGDLPPPLVGASTTVVGNKVWLYGGKLNSSRRNYTPDIYCCDLETATWERITPNSPPHLTPGARCFHSANVWGQLLVIFGGIGDSDSRDEEQTVLSDVRFFHLSERRWLEPVYEPSSASSSTRLVNDPSPSSTSRPPTANGERTSSTPSPAPGPSSSASDEARHDHDEDSNEPRPRFAHLAAITAHKLYVIGGQDMTSKWLDNVHVFDLRQRRWIAHSDVPRNCGTYRSVVVAADLIVRDPKREGVSNKRPPSKFAALKSQQRSNAASSSTAGPGPGPGLSSSVNDGMMVPPNPSSQANSDELVLMPYSSEPTEETPCNLFIYSNWNFVEVKRELEMINPTEEVPHLTSYTDSMLANSRSQPPGLRFPTGYILGNFLIVAGTFLAQSSQSYSVWALDMNNMSWMRIDPGAVLNSGSWSRGLLWREANRFVVFGNRQGNLVEDYNRRVVKWDHIAFIELETLGVYQPPRQRVSHRAQITGLDAFEAEVLAEFEILCEDGRRIRCSRKLLEDRWPWFKNQRIRYVDAAKAIVERQRQRGPDGQSEFERVGGRDEMVLSSQQLFALPESDRPDPRLTPRLLRLSEPYPVTKAFLQYFYAYDLVTPLQHTPLVLSALLLLANIYELPHLAELVKHAMHMSLSNVTCVAIWDVTTLCDCQNLNIRALRLVMNSNKRAARAARSPGDGGGGGGDRTDDDHDHHTDDDSSRRHDRPSSSRDQRQYYGGRSRSRGYSDANPSPAFGASQMGGGARGGLDSDAANFMSLLVTGTSSGSEDESESEPDEEEDERRRRHHSGAPMQRQESDELDPALFEDERNGVRESRIWARPDPLPVAPSLPRVSSPTSSGASRRSSDLESVMDATMALSMLTRDVYSPEPTLVEDREESSPTPTQQSYLRRPHHPVRQGSFSSMATVNGAKDINLERATIDFAALSMLDDVEESNPPSNSGRPKGFVGTTAMYITKATQNGRLNRPGRIDIDHILSDDFVTELPYRNQRHPPTAGSGPMRPNHIANRRGSAAFSYITSATSGSDSSSSSGVLTPSDERASFDSGSTIRAHRQAHQNGQRYPGVHHVSDGEDGYQQPLARGRQGGIPRTRLSDQTLVNDKAFIPSVGRYDKGLKYQPERFRGQYERRSPSASGVLDIQRERDVDISIRSVFSDETDEDENLHGEITEISALEGHALDLTTSTSTGLAPGGVEATSPTSKLFSSAEGTKSKWRKMFGQGGAAHGESNSPKAEKPKTPKVKHMGGGRRHVAVPRNTTRVVPGAAYNVNGYSISGA